MLEAYTGFQAGSTTCRRGRGIPGVGGGATGGRPNNGLPLELNDQPGRPVIGSGNAWYASMCVCVCLCACVCRNCLPSQMS